MAFRLVCLLAITIASGTVVAGGGTNNVAVPAAMKLSDELKAKVKHLDADSYTRSRNVETIISSHEFRNKVSQHINRTANSLGIPRRAEAPVLVNTKGPTFILFVSSSMPLQTLRNYASDLYAIDGIMVFRGLIGDETKLKPTIDFIRSILVDDPSCMHAGCPTKHLKIAIDPARFREHHVHQVPTGIIEETPSFEPNCNEGITYSSLSKRVIGDISIQGMLQEMITTRNNGLINNLLNKLEVAR